VSISPCVIFKSECFGCILFFVYFWRNVLVTAFIAACIVSNLQRVMQDIWWIIDKIMFSQYCIKWLLSIMTSKRPFLSNRVNFDNSNHYLLNNSNVDLNQLTTSVVKWLEYSILCDRSWVRVSVGSKQRLCNLYLLLLS
jgi:hypothetical protein